MVGPGALGVPLSRLRSINATGRIGSWPTDQHPWDNGGWIPTTPYVYNNNSGNHGGVVPAGGMDIDGFFVPGGAFVSQFNSFANATILTGNAGGQSPPFPGIVFRGCSWRGTSSAPGFLNLYANSNTNVWLLYCDAGAIGPANAQVCEVPFALQDMTSKCFFFRNYISYCATGLQLNTGSASIIENFIENITFYFGPGNPPGQSGPYHLNGITFNGGQPNALVLRNQVLVQSPDKAGRTVDQTDCISFFQDFGSFPGTGRNIDGSVGYLVEGNFVGGGGYCFYAGLNAGGGQTSIKNMVMINNFVSTRWWPNGGFFGPCAAQPNWGANGNVARNNKWADGPNAGKVAFGS
jgi:hypothetical protein